MRSATDSVRESAALMHPLPLKNPAHRMIFLSSLHKKLLLRSASAALKFRLSPPLRSLQEAVRLHLLNGQTDCRRFPSGQALLFLLKEYLRMHQVS